MRTLESSQTLFDNSKYNSVSIVLQQTGKKASIVTSSYFWSHKLGTGLSSSHFEEGHLVSYTTLLP
jgi:hypothetical protein